MLALQRRFSTLALSLALVLPATAGAAPSEGLRRSGPERLQADALAQPALESRGAAEPSLPALPPTADDALAQRLAILGLPADLQEALLADAPAAQRGDADALARAQQALGAVAESPEGAKARMVFETWLAGLPLGLVGAELELEDRLLLGELLRQGVETETAGWLVLAGRSVGWPAGVAERESLREAFATALAGRPALLEGALDAAALRSQAPVLLSPAERDELLRPPAPADHPPGDQRTVVCRACPYWNFGLLYPGDEWETHESSLLAGECKVYRFVLRQGETYRFSFCNGGGTADFDTVLTGTDGLCNLAAFDDDSCGTLSEIEYTAGVTGYFYLQVRDAASAGGHYRLAYRRVAAPGGDPEAGCTSCPEYDANLGYPTLDWRTVDGSILSGGCRTYRFNVLGGHTYRFTTCEPDSGGTAAFDTVIESTNTSQACYDGPWNDDTCGTGSTIEFTPRFAQYVTITVRGFGLADHGSFSLAYRDVTGECVDCPDAYLPEIVPDATRRTVGGYVPAGGGCDLIPVRVEAGKSYRFDANDGLPGSFTNLDVALQLLDGSCTPIPRDAFDVGFSAYGVWSPCYTGLAWLRVQANDGTGFGEYGLSYTEACGWIAGCRQCSVQDGPHAPDASIQSTSFFLPADGCRVLAFDLQAGRTYRFTPCGGPGGLSPGQVVSLRIRRPGCDACPGIVTGDCSGPPPTRLDFTPTQTATYYLVIEEVGGVSGDATLAFGELADCTNTVADVALAPYATGTVGGTLTVRDGARFVRFTGPPGRTYRFTICNQDSEGFPLGGTAPANSALVVMTGGPTPCSPDLPNSFVSQTCAGGNETDLTIPASGELYLKVARLCGGIGPFTLGYADVTPRIVFVTDALSGGALGGAFGAYTSCTAASTAPTALPQVQAVTAGGGEFFSWVSDGFSGGPASYYPANAGPGVFSPADLVRPDGTLLWANINEIFLGGLPPAAPIQVTESGATVPPGAAVWSSTDPTGNGPIGPNCFDWADGTAGFLGLEGDPAAASPAWTDSFAASTCDTPRHLYCFEVP